MNNPVNFNDPTGHCFEPVTGTMCAVAVTGLAVLAVGALYMASPQFRESANAVAESAGAVVESIVLDYKKNAKKAWQTEYRIQQILKDMSNTGGTPKGNGGGCLKSAKNAVMCVGVVGGLIALGVGEVLTGGCDQDGSNSSCADKPAELQVRDHSPIVGRDKSAKDARTIRLDEIKDTPSFTRQRSQVKKIDKMDNLTRYSNW